MFGEEDSHSEGHELKLFEIQKQIEYLKQLKERNQALASKLREIQSKVITKMKSNDLLLKNFRYRRVRAEQPKTAIVGISFYNYENQQKIPKSLETYYELQFPKEKQSIFLKNVFENSSQADIPSNLIDYSTKLQDIVKGYPTNPSSIPFDRIGVFYGVTGLKVYELWRQAKLRPQPRKILFTKQQNDAILALHKKYGDNWKHISKLTEFRSSQQLYYQFNVINPQFTKGRWKISQNIKLLILAQYYQLPNYHKMALKLKTRSEGQIRERYTNVLEPGKRIKQWTQQQTNLLVQKANDFNYKWAKLAELFEHKTDNQVWRKFRGVMAQKTHQEIQQQVWDKKIRQTILKYKQKYQVKPKIKILNTVYKQPKLQQKD